MPDQDRLPKLKVIRDNPEVQVRGDIGFALRILRRKVQLCGNHRVLNLRRKYPNRKDRRRLKDRMATQRVRRINKLLRRNDNG